MILLMDPSRSLCIGCLASIVKNATPKLTSCLVAIIIVMIVYLCENVRRLISFGKQVGGDTRVSAFI